jgi:hypothetical protein
MFRTRLMQIGFALVAMTCLVLLSSGAVNRSAPTRSTVDDVDVNALIDSIAGLDCADYLPRDSSNPRVQAARDLCMGYGK